MTEDLHECYRKLGTEPGASFETVDLSYQQLLTVWNPERFHHDPALQATAWRKLQELNAAYAQVCAHSGQVPRFHVLPVSSPTAGESSTPAPLRYRTAGPETPQQKTLQRVRLISLLDGWSLIGFAALGTLVTLLFGDLVGMGVGLMIAMAGAMELHGRKRLTHRDPDGMKWLVRSQLFLLAVVLAYCASRLGSFDQDTVMGNLTPDMEAILHESGIEKKDILPLVRVAFFSLYGGVALTTLLYQGGMALYYRSRIKPVTDALNQPSR